MSAACPNWISTVLSDADVDAAAAAAPDRIPVAHTSPGRDNASFVSEESSRGLCAFAMAAFPHKDAMASIDHEILEQQHVSAESGGDDDEEEAYISQFDPLGNIEQVPVKYLGSQEIHEKNEAEAAPTANPGDFINATESLYGTRTGIKLFTKPFNFVSGNLPRRNRFNPFRRKASGLMGVISQRLTRNRMVAKNGALNLQSTAQGQRHRLLRDMFITIIDLSWSYIIVLFAAAFLLSWLFFACIWYLTFLQHGDFDEENIANESFVPCATAVQGFTACYLFSIETQHTIGYGGRATTEECPFAVMLMSIQSIMGVVIQCFMAGIIFAKFTVPRNRGETIIFSKNAVISMRNGHLYLMMRVADLRKASLLGAQVIMTIVRKEQTEEGEMVPYQMSQMECGCELEAGCNRLFLMWPAVVAHRVDARSPLYAMGPQDILRSQFEIVVTLEGTVEETSNTIQVRSSYLPNEILWGHHFEHTTVAYDKSRGVYSVQNSKINKTTSDSTPRFSALYLDNMRKQRQTSHLHKEEQEPLSD